MYLLLRNFGTYEYIQIDTAWDRNFHFLWLYFKLRSLTVFMLWKIIAWLIFLVYLATRLWDAQFGVWIPSEVWDLSLLRRVQTELGPTQTVIQRALVFVASDKVPTVWRRSLHLHAIPRTSWHEQRHLCFTLFSDTVQSFFFLSFFFFFPMPPHVLCGLRGPPSWAWQECNRLLSLGRPWGAVTLSRLCVSGDRGECSARRGLKPKFY